MCHFQNYTLKKKTFPRVYLSLKKPSVVVIFGMS